MNIRHITWFSLAALLLTACGFGRPQINGGDSDQPIMDGWTYEEAAEYWLGSVLDDEHTLAANGKAQWLTPDSLARLTKGHVNLSLPVHDSQPLPRWGVTYRQARTGGYITFRDSASTHPLVSGDILQSVGMISYHFQDNQLPQVTDSTAYMQSRGKGLFTAFWLSKVRTRQKDGSWIIEPNEGAKWCPFVISVYPGGDSLLVSRGLKPVEVFVNPPRCHR